MKTLENTILFQLYSFFIYAISGIAIGILFDIFRILRKSFRTPDILTYIEDVLFWLLTGVFLLFVLFQISNGEIRIYHIVGILLGSIFYMLTISKYFIKINVSVITFLKNILYHVLIYPTKLICFLLRKIGKPFTFFVINIKKITLKSSKKMKKKEKKYKKKQKNAREGRILKTNVENYK